MPLTMDNIKNALLPIHRAIAQTNDKDLKSAGIALHNFMDGAQKLSANLAQALQIHITEQELPMRPELQGVFQGVVLAAYQEALSNFADEAKRFVGRITEIAVNKDPSVRDRCDAASKTLTRITARDDLSLRRDRNQRGWDGPG